MIFKQDPSRGPPAPCTPPLQHLPVAKVSLYGYVNPLVAVVVGALILGERFGVREAVTTAIVLGAVALARRRTPETA